MAQPFHTSSQRDFEPRHCRERATESQKLERWRAAVVEDQESIADFVAQTRRMTIRREIVGRLCETFNSFGREAVSELHEVSVTEIRFRLTRAEWWVHTAQHYKKRIATDEDRVGSSFSTKDFRSQDLQHLSGTIGVRVRRVRITEFGSKLIARRKSGELRPFCVSFRE
jgi:hypothetical protein